ncbi:MAG: hypothetical protein KDD53_11130, partial [Bdellovibrionales bacterium]|nr:hypothetical protein [Bdellovibrionales bacterium]
MTTNHVTQFNFRQVHKNLRLFWDGVDTFSARLQKQKALYAELFASAENKNSGDRLVIVSDPVLFDTTIHLFGPALPSNTRRTERLYEVVLDRELGAIIIANRGATLWCLSPKTETPYLARHIGISIYVPGLGIETLNVGLVGDVYNGPIAVRSESACTPSFLFGSQRCNCCHQWDSFRELAAAYNTAEEPELSPQAFENWVQEQLTYQDGYHKFKTNGPGFVFIHFDSQNGMGSGITPGEFSSDLFNRASLRHRGEYSAEQIFKTTMAGGFTAIGLEPDPRALENNLGYRITPLVLDYLKVSRTIILFSNNYAKIRELQKKDYCVKRVKHLGAVNQAGAVEAEQRGTEFG